VVGRTHAFYPGSIPRYLTRQIVWVLDLLLECMSTLPSEDEDDSMYYSVWAPRPFALATTNQVQRDELSRDELCSKIGLKFI
jgi:hypothetical protein